MILPEQVSAMADVGFTPEQIAHRLECSTRQVRRIASDCGIEFWENCLIDTSEERTILWETLRQAGYAPPRIAFMVGRSRQTVTEYFSLPRITNYAFNDVQPQPNRA